MASLSFHPDARDEYDAALKWYSDRSARAATRFESQVDRVVGAVVANPEAFPEYDAVHRMATVRKYPYSVVYRTDPDGVRVIALAHAKRRPGYWLGRE